MHLLHHEGLLHSIVSVLLFIPVGDEQCRRLISVTISAFQTFFSKFSFFMNSTPFTWIARSMKMNLVIILFKDVSVTFVSFYSLSCCFWFDNQALFDKNICLVYSPEISGIMITMAHTWDVIKSMPQMPPEWM